MKRVRMKVHFEKRICYQVVARCCILVVLSDILLGPSPSRGVELPRYSGKYESRVDNITKIRLTINPNSTIASGIRDIWHIPSEQTICIETQTNASCPRPAFIGRLAGQSIAMLDWKQQNDERFGSSMRCGSYHDRWLSAGTYFLDIIVLFCEDFGVNSLSKAKNESDWLSFDFKNTCMEDPSRNRVTGEDSFIFIQENITSSVTPMGRWIPPSPQNPIPLPLFHRYQALGCFRNPGETRCVRSRTPLWSYSVEWKEKFGERWRERIKTSKDSSNFTKVCFVGYSHSRELESAFERHGLGKHVEHILAQYPEDVNSALLNHSYSDIGCRTLVIAVAQWPGSRASHFPYLFDQFYRGMKGILQTAFELFSDRSDDVRVYMRSIHEIPIGKLTGSTCPMVDWRSPVVMNGYSHLVKKAVKEIRQRHEIATRMIHCLDTSFIVSPMWDSAPDWIHLPVEVSDEEALYIASVVSR